MNEQRSRRDIALAEIRGMRETIALDDAAVASGDQLREGRRPLILAHGTAPPRRGPAGGGTPLAEIWTSIERLFRGAFKRLEALEKRRDGRNGRDGMDGTDGRGIAAARLDDGCLVLVYSDGAEQNVGRVVPEAAVEMTMTVRRDEGGKIVGARLKR